MSLLNRALPKKAVKPLALARGELTLFSAPLILPPILIMKLVNYFNNKYQFFYLLSI